LINHTITLTALPQILSRRKWLILACGLAGAILAAEAVRVMPRGVTSQAAIIIDDSQLGPAGPAGATVNLEDILRTQKDVLQSRGVISQTVQSLDLQNTNSLAPSARWPHWLAAATSGMVNGVRSLVTSLEGGASDTTDTDNTPENNAIAYIQKSLRLTSTEASSMILLEFTAGTRATATSVLDSIMKSYLSDRETARTLSANQTSRLLSQRAATMKAQADDAQKKLEAFLRQHSLPEVQGSLADTVLLSRAQEQLETAHNDLAKAQAKLDILDQFGAGSLPEVLASPTIQRYRDQEAQLVSKLAVFGPADPRRQSPTSALNSVRDEIRRETDKIASSIKSNAQLAAANVKQLESTVAKNLSTSQDSTVVRSTLASLRSDLEAKQQMFVAFERSAADQQRIEMSQPPLARILYPATVIPSRRLGWPALLLGFLVGTLVSSAAVLARRVFNATVRSPLDLAIATNSPIYGSVPEITGNTSARARAEQVTSETLRALCVAIQPDQRGQGDVVLVTSCESGEGKTTFATRMAQTYAYDGHRVLLIDGDLRRPRLASALGLQPTHPIEAVLAGTIPWTEAVVRNADTGLDCLLAGGRCRNPISAINSQHLTELLAESRALYDFIIVDSPPVLRVADPLLLAQRCQHVMFVVRAGYMSPDLVYQAMQRFPAAERSKTKMMLVRVEPNELDKGDYYGGYGMTSIGAS
jgi:polysaccharide biosynthesis transport protein